jgi:hypothetical protein
MNESIYPYIPSVMKFGGDPANAGAGIFGGDALV